MYAFMAEKAGMNNLELSSERFDDARDFVRHAMQHTNDREALYGVASVAEQYAGRKVDIHLHLMLNPDLKSPTLITHQDGDATFWQWQDMSDLCVRM